MTYTYSLFEPMKFGEKMRSRRVGLLFLVLLAAFHDSAFGQRAQGAWQDADTAKHIQALIASTPRLEVQRSILPLPPAFARSLGMISWLAVEPTNGVIYLLHRGTKTDSIVAVDREGHVQRSWGRELFTTAHSIRLDKAGNIWTVDSGSSRALKFSADGKKLLEIQIGGKPPSGSFNGATDIAFGPDGGIYVSDGYRNARILEYTPDGRLCKQWGDHGAGPSQFNVPHAIVIGADGVVYVADRENGRVQRFDLMGRYLGEWDGLGKPMSLRLQADGSLLVGTGYHNQAGLSPAWLAWILKVDTRTGSLLGYVEVGDDAHALETLADGDILTGGEQERVSVVHRFRLAP